MGRLRFYLFFILQWLKFYFSAKTFKSGKNNQLREFLIEVVENNRNYYTFLVVEGLRKKLLNNNTRLKITDFGAGSKITTSNTRTISDLARNSAISANLGKILFNISRFSKPKNILELGTSLGISTLYLAGGAPLSKFITIEGCPETAKVASNNLKNVGMTSIKVQQGPFSEQLPKALKDLKSPDLIYIDGDHQKGRTLQYVDTCLPFLKETSIIVVADIHWSGEMAEAWNLLKQKPQVTSSFDLFDFGILFFDDKAADNVHFSIVKKSWKPWRF